MANLDPTRLTDAEKAKAAQAKMILWLVMLLFAALPVLLWWLIK